MKPKERLKLASKIDIGDFKGLGTPIKFTKTYQWRNENRNEQGFKELFMIIFHEDEDVIFKGCIFGNSRSYISIHPTEEEIKILSGFTHNLRFTDDLTELSTMFILFNKLD